MTENVEEVWDREPAPYLRAVKDHDFCRWSKFFDWIESFPAEELLAHIQTYLQAKGDSSRRVGGAIQDIQIISRTASGRVRSLRVSTEAGSVVLYKDQVRWAFGRHNRPGIMPSTNITLDLERRADGTVAKVHVSGYGYGHGVGMCQTGAIGMARFGYDYEKILSHYYSGAKIKKLY
jgi:stage II sporulation protein D